MRGGLPWNGTYRGARYLAVKTVKMSISQKSPHILHIFCPFDICPCLPKGCLVCISSALKHAKRVSQTCKPQSCGSSKERTAYCARYALILCGSWIWRRDICPFDIYPGDIFIEWDMSPSGTKKSTKRYKENKRYCRFWLFNSDLYYCFQAISQWNVHITGRESTIFRYFQHENSHDKTSVKQGGLNQPSLGLWSALVGPFKQYWGEVQI